MRRHASAFGLVCYLFACGLSSSTAGAQETPTDSAANDFDVYPYLGLAIDNFAASNVSDYLNPQDSGDSKTRETFGIAFQYQLFESGYGKKPKTGEWSKLPSKQVQRYNRVSVYGQTTHGVRSTDIDCEANPDNPLCVPFGPEIANAQNDPTQRALYILRNASSLEAVIGLRYEFLSLRTGAASLYTTIQEGFVAVEDDDDDVADINHIAFGARIMHGNYRDSFVEIARGENDLFDDHPNDRSKVIARLVTRPKGFPGLVFAHIVADVDGGDGADSVQTYLGIAFCFGGGKAACERDK